MAKKKSISSIWRKEQIQIAQKWRPKKDSKTKGSILPPKISRQLRDIIHGYIMSDGYVSPEGTVEHSCEQKDFTEWMFVRTIKTPFDKQSKTFTSFQTRQRIPTHIRTVLIPEIF